MCDKIQDSTIYILDDPERHKICRVSQAAGRYKMERDKQDDLKVCGSLNKDVFFCVFL